MVAEANALNGALSLNAILELLAHHYRRETLRFLSDVPNQTATVDELANRLITWEAERTGKRPARDEIEAQLHHIHLPKMTEAGIIEYDTRSKELRYWREERLEDLLSYLSS